MSDSERDCESVTSSQNCRNRSSSVGSQRSNGLDWNVLCEFDSVEEGEYFVKNQLTQNATIIAYFMTH